MSDDRDTIEQLTRERDEALAEVARLREAIAGLVSDLDDRWTVADASSQRYGDSDSSSEALAYGDAHALAEQWLGRATGDGSGCGDD